MKAVNWSFLLELNDRWCIWFLAFFVFTRSVLSLKYFCFVPAKAKCEKKTSKRSFISLVWTLLDLWQLSTVWPEGNFSFSLLMSGLRDVLRQTHCVFWLWGHSLHSLHMGTGGVGYRQQMLLWTSVHVLQVSCHTEASPVTVCTADRSKSWRRAKLYTLQLFEGKARRGIWIKIQARTGRILESNRCFLRRRENSLSEWNLSEIDIMN